jgi:hypothetical protein
MKRATLLSLLFSPLLAGCFYYAYPTFSHIPDLQVPNPVGDVHAFRVDTDPRGFTGHPAVTLARVPVNSQGGIPGQLEIGHEMGYVNYWGTREHSSQRHAMLLRLYRPGHELIEVRTVDKQTSLDWRPVKDFAAQERAVDALTMLPAESGATTPNDWWTLNTPLDENPLQSGAASPAAREALLFASSEYERLARDPQLDRYDQQPTRDRLRAKAACLRRHAEAKLAPI